jgi:aspartate-semialdehyde dehydrogenase
MKKVGFIGWRGMVGSVLMDRMREENDFNLIESYFFSTTKGGELAPVVPNGSPRIFSAMNISDLLPMDIIVTCQGGEFTSEMHPILRNEGWKGYWVDAASTLRMKDSSVIVLDPVNRHIVQDSISKGMKDFVGGNCTVSLMLIALHGLFKEGLIEWISSMTYQAASGAGAKNMLELLAQMEAIGKAYTSSPSVGALEMEKKVNHFIGQDEFPKSNFGHSLALNLLPWIDSEMPNGQSKEEWKAQVEANKILQTSQVIPIDGTCVRVGALRCHSQALTIKLKKSVDLNTIESLIAGANNWVKLIPNNKPDTLSNLTPSAVSGKLEIPIGRVRKMSLGDQYLNAFTCGDQLLWGAAEPLRCVLRNLVI